MCMCGIHCDEKKREEQVDIHVSHHRHCWLVYLEYLHRREQQSSCLLRMPLWIDVKYDIFYRGSSSQESTRLLVCFALLWMI